MAWQRVGRAARLVPLLALTLAGCGLDPKPYDFRPIDEIPAGPGLITGEEGAFTYETQSPFLDRAPATAEAPKQGSLPRPATHPPYAP